MIFEKTFNAEAKRNEFSQSDYHDNRVGFWGVVVEVNAANLTCTVQSDVGRCYKEIPVISKEWVCDEENKNFVSAAKNLPPIGSVVFVLMPTRTISGAFILCSGYTRGNDNLKTLFAENYEKESKARTKEIKTCGGWNFSEDYDSGNLTLESDSKDIKIEINPNEDFEKNQCKKILIKGWKSEITVTESGITISANGSCQTSIEGDSNLFVSGNLSAFVSGNLEAEIEGTSTIEAKQDVSLTTSKLTINDTSLEVV